MIMRSIRLSSLLIVLIIAGCCKAPGNKPSGGNNSPEPIWAQNLMVGSSATMVWNGGVGAPIKYKNVVIYGTTLISTNEIEDNRLCGLDAETGEIKWYFPSDLNQTYNYQFEGKGYIYNNSLVVKSPPMGDLRSQDEVLNIDLNTRQLIHSYVSPGKDGEISYHCYGYDRYFVWEEHMAEESRIYKMDIETGNVQIIASRIPPDNANFYFKIVGFNDGELIYTEMAFDSEKSLGQYVCKYNIETEELAYRNKVELEYERHSLWAGYFKNNYFDDDVAYLLMGPYVLAMDTDKGKVIWSVDTKEVPNYWLNCIVICGDKLFLSGENIYMAMDKSDGKILYKKEVSGCKWSTQNKGYIYSYINENVYVIDCGSGSILSTICCPEKQTNGDGFNATIPPSFHDGKMYLMSYTTAYCYPAYPW